MSISSRLDWRTIASSSPIGWAHKATRGQYRAPRHVQFFAGLQQDIIAGREELILLSVPPRHGKSMSWCEMFPGFFLGNRPDQSIQLASYEAGLAAGFGEKARNNFNEAGPDVFGLSVSKRRNATDDWRVARRRGGMQTTGVGGAMTGKTAHLMLVDDPIKGSEQANSETMRAKLWDWWESEAKTRLTPYVYKGRKRMPACVVIHTRWHEDDLIGRLLAEQKAGGPLKWRYINLPAIAEEGVLDPLGRQPGEALWPEMFDVEWLARYRTNPYWWSALYQGRPQPATGGIFKRSYLRYFVEEPHYFTLHIPGDLAPKRVPKDAGYMFSTTDPASSLSTTADYTVTCVWFVTPDNDLLLVDIVRDRIEGPEQLDLVDNLRRRYRLAFCGFESKSYQATSVQHLSRRGVPVMELHADADKVTRAMTAAARMSQGQIYLRQGGYPNTTPLCDLDTIEGELLGFPRAAHDDIVDNFSYAAIHVADGRPGAA